MLKRIITLLIALTFIISLSACSTKTANMDNTRPTGTKVPGIFGDDRYEEEKEFVKLEPIAGLKDVLVVPPDSSGVRKQGEFPIKVKDGEGVTAQENKYYKTILCQAIIDMDTNVLDTTLVTNDLVLLYSIYNNPNYREIYKSTIGKAVYLPESEVFVIKDVDWIFYKWYSDLYEKSGPMPVSIESLTICDINEIYNKYYNDAPYKIVSTAGMSFKLNRGHIKYNIKDVLTQLFGASCDLRYLTPDNKGYGNFVLGGNCYHFSGKSIDPDCIYDSKYDLWKIVYKFDTDSMIEWIENDDSLLTENNWNSDYDQFIYSVYYQNQERKDAIEKWVGMNYEIYRGVDDIKIFVDVHDKYINPYQMFTPRERAYLEKLHVVESIQCGAGDQWGAFRVAVEDMVNTNAFQ